MLIDDTPIGCSTEDGFVYYLDVDDDEAVIDEIRDVLKRHGLLKPERMDDRMEARKSPWNPIYITK